MLQRHRAEEECCYLNNNSVHVAPSTDKVLYHVIYGIQLKAHLEKKMSFAYFVSDFFHFRRVVIGKKQSFQAYLSLNSFEEI